MRRIRVIDWLRKNYGEGWTYDPRAHQWNGPCGRYVHAVAASSPRYDGDDDTFHTEYWMYSSIDRGFVPVQLYFTSGGM